jgi:RNA recognition motif-containing protein
MKLFVGNIAYASSEESLRALFSQYASLRSVKIATDRETGRSRGFGFVELDNDDEAREAIEAINGQNLDGKTLNVNEARPREDRPRSGGGGGFGGGGGGGGRGGDRRGGSRGGYSGGGRY